MRAGQDNRAKRKFLCFNNSMENFLYLAEQNQQAAWKIIKELDIENIWRNTGAEINLVGSLKMGLLMKHLDIDFHVYSEQLSISESFKAILKIFKNPKVKSFWFKNLLNTDENCLEWHLIYRDESSRDWQIDLIHMSLNSKYHGYFENVADRINGFLTDDIRQTILRLKYETPDDLKIAGIEYYRAVISDCIKSYEDFVNWRRKNVSYGIDLWCP